MTDKPTCGNCPQPDDKGEWYRFIAAVFDVKQAREFITPDREVFDLTEENLRALQLPLERPVWEEDKEGRRFMTITCGTAINEEHLSHIPEEKLDEPCILVPYRIWSKSQKSDIMAHIIIDGSHRAVRLFREGKPVRAYMLTEQEAVDICTNREPCWWKGVRRTVRKKAA